MVFFFLLPHKVSTASTAKPALPLLSAYITVAVAATQQKIRSPGIRRVSFARGCRLYNYALLNELGLFYHLLGYPAITFLFFSCTPPTLFCHQLPSDSSSPTTPLLRLVDGVISASSEYCLYFLYRKFCDIRHIFFG